MSNESEDSFCFLFEMCTFTTLGAGQVVTVSSFNQFSHVSFLSNLQRIDCCLPTTPGAIKANQRIEKTKIFWSKIPSRSLRSSSLCRHSLDCRSRRRTAPARRSLAAKNFCSAHSFQLLHRLGGLERLSSWSAWEVGWCQIGRLAARQRCSLWGEA